MCCSEAGPGVDDGYHLCLDTGRLALRSHCRRFVFPASCGLGNSFTQNSGHPLSIML